MWIKVPGGVDIIRVAPEPGGPRAWISIKAVPGWDTFPEHRHEGSWEIVYVRKGPVTHMVNGARLIQNRGALTFIREKDRHLIEGYDTEHVNIVISSTYHAVLRGPDPRPDDRLARIFADPGIISGRVPPDEQEEFDRRLNQLFFHQGTEYETLLFCAFFYDLLARYLTRPPAEGIRANLPAWMARCLDHLDRHPDQPLSITRLVDLCGKTQEHVSRCFHRYLGMTPSAFVNDRRLRQAERLLAHSDLPVKSVWAQTGFGGETYFFRLFRRRFGMSPQEYRSRHTAGAGHP